MSPKDATGPDRQKTRPRRHGYRGFGSPLHEGSGAIHWGRGFAGIGFPGEGGSLLPPAADLVPRDLRERLLARKDESGP